MKRERQVAVIGAGDVGSDSELWEGAPGVLQAETPAEAVALALEAL